MQITFDPAKRDKILLERGLDFARAPEVFASRHFSDAVEVNGEKRFFTMGLLDNRIVVVVWMWRSDSRRIISMRKANDREQQKYRQRLD
jgi:hypothetical protein